MIGLFSDSSFLRGTLEKLKVDATYAHAGKYKSAPEAFTEYGFSPPAREAIAALLDGEFEQLVKGIAEGRKLAPEDVRQLIDQAPLSAEAALDHKLVDALMYPDEFQTATDAALASAPSYVDLERYNAPQGSARGQVAVVFAAGTIVRGGGGEQPWTQELYVGSDSLSETLESLAEDTSVDAVVLRIDSPGGSALASDLIQRRVAKLQEAKPVVVSMSDLAASGGYYIAAPAKKIVAQPGTLTGSIGVFAGKFSTRRFQEDWLGIRHETLQRGANADYFSTLDPMRPEQAERFSRGVERTYARFVKVVATGRRMTTEAVDAVAQGRVWTGEAARQAGLVDELGASIAVGAGQGARGVPGSGPRPPALPPRSSQRARPHFRPASNPAACGARGVAPSDLASGSNLRIAAKLSRLNRPF